MATYLKFGDKNPELPQLRKDLAELLNNWLGGYNTDYIPYSESEKMALKIIVLLDNDECDIKEKIAECITDAIARKEVEIIELDDQP